MEEIGNIIYQKRTELGLTLEDVGNAVGVGKSTVRKWEKGMIKNMGRDKVAALAKVLGINPATLIRPDTDETDHDQYSEDQKVLFRLAETATSAAIRAAVAVLKSMEETNNDF